MKSLVLLALLAVACFREAKPCDDASYNKVAETCTSRDDCLEQLDKLDELCGARIRGGE